MKSSYGNHLLPLTHISQLISSHLSLWRNCCCWRKEHKFIFYSTSCYCARISGCSSWNQDSLKYQSVIFQSLWWNFLFTMIIRCKVWEGVAGGVSPTAENEAEKISSWWSRGYTIFHSYSYVHVKAIWNLFSPKLTLRNNNHQFGWWNVEWIGWEWFTPPNEVSSETEING